MKELGIETIRAVMTAAFPTRHLYLLHDREGRIEEFLNTMPSTQLEPVLHSLKRAGTLSSYFNLSVLTGTGESLPINQISGTDLNAFGTYLYALLPQCSLVTRYVGDGLYLARVSVFEYQPMMQSQTFNNYIFADHEKDLLMGFSERFYDYFKLKHGSAQNMLGRPLAEFLSPTPREFQQSLIPRFHPDTAEGFRVATDLEFSSLGEPQKYLTLPLPLNTREQDFILTLQIEATRGEPPYLILGNRHRPDENGYTLGTASFGTPAGRHFLLKRLGFSARLSAPSLPPSGVPVYHFCKIGQSLFLFENGVQQLAYYDADFLHERERFLSLGLRQGSACRVLKTGLSVRKAPDSRGTVHPPRLICRLKSGEERHFTMDPFSNPTLTSPNFYHVSGYFLNDITEMQERISSLDRKYHFLLRKVEGDAPAFIGASPAIRAVQETARLAASSDATVLIEGPTGSGKEVLARYIHEKSPRRNGPFIKADCATFPAGLAESSLFGHEKGAFTGAVGRNIGLFEAADQGTLFLDEAGNLTPAIQVKLLQFLNDFTITRVGGVKPMKLNVRVVAASNTPLDALVREGKFREDLFYRLHVVFLKLPPLKERKEDIDLLSRHFLARFAAEQGKKVSDFTEHALKKLVSHDWPGNVRELSNVIQRAVIFCQTDKVDTDLIHFLPGNARASSRAKSPFLLSKTSSAEILRILKKHNGQAAQAAKELGMGRTTLYKFFREKGIDPRGFRKGFRGKAG